MNAVATVRTSPEPTNTQAAASRLTSQKTLLRHDDSGPLSREHRMYRNERYVQ